LLRAMGNGRSSNRDFISDLEARVGRIPLSGRYHKAPKKLEDDYDVCDQVLGSGYSGAVRLATRRGDSPGSQKKYAVKAFKLSSVAADKRGQLESEVAIYLCMDHPHITRLFDVYDTNDNLDLVMECMEGGELFDRVIELRTFSEADAADAVYQMLLALNYIHSHGIVHRDLKLENFLYESKESSHLKLIDFGFSKVWDPNIKMHMSCGTLSYVAPEVLKKSYTSQCDLWSLGVIAFILLVGYMPFSGSEDQQTKDIAEGKFKMKQERWAVVTSQARSFVTSLLQVNPEKRLTAQTALQHKWISQRHKNKKDCEVDSCVVEALRSFGRASKFRRCCMEMMAWSLSNEERAKVRQYFISMDKDRNGTITLNELKAALEDKFHVPDEEARAIFSALDSNSDEEIHYSDFLAAMVSTRIKLHDGLLQHTFRRFDTDNSGYITKENLQEILGDSCDDVDKLVAEADMLKDGRISYPEFVAYLRGDPLDEHAHQTVQLIDSHLEASQEFQKGTLQRRKSKSAVVGTESRTDGEDEQTCAIL